VTQMMRFSFNRSRNRVPISKAVYDMLQRLIRLMGLVPNELDEFLFCRAGIFFKDEQRKMYTSTDVLQGFRKCMNRPDIWAAADLMSNKLNNKLNYSKQSTWSMGQNRMYSGQCKMHLRQVRVCGINSIIECWIKDPSSMDQQFKDCTSAEQLLKHTAWVADTSVEKLESNYLRYFSLGSFGVVGEEARRRVEQERERLIFNQLNT
jgi:hypothetical protein